MNDLHVYDTTLRDGAQQEGLNLSVADKLAIAAHLDELGVGYIEGGWPGANPKDTEFFARAAASCRCATPRSPRSAPRGAPARWRRRTRRCSRCSSRAPPSSRSWPRATCVTSRRRCAPPRRRTWRWSATPSASCAAEGRRVFLDAEHFFDGYLADRAYALEVLRTAAEAGAEVVALCDTNGGHAPAAGR